MKPKALKEVYSTMEAKGIEKVFVTEDGNHVFRKQMIPDGQDYKTYSIGQIEDMYGEMVAKEYEAEQVAEKENAERVAAAAAIADAEQKEKLRAEILKELKDEADAKAKADAKKAAEAAKKAAEPAKTEATPQQPTQ
jgi:hypothetical protein